MWNFPYTIVDKVLEANVIIVYDSLHDAGLTKLNFSNDSTIERAIIILSDSTQPYKQVGVVAHEFGHLLGLQHSHDSNSVMWYSARLPHFSLTQTDKDSLLKFYNMKKWW
jgi:predicted Zn-dependent protease